MSIDMAAHLAQWNLYSAFDRGGEAQYPIIDIQALIRANDDLPPLPEITRRLLHFRDDPNASTTALAEIVELDPLLAGQMLRWANSAYYGLRTPTESVRDAIVRVLGFNNALALALALAARPDVVAATYRRALALDPRVVDAPDNLFTVLGRMGRTELAAQIRAGL